jgi:hypothetical protein
VACGSPLNSLEIRMRQPAPSGEGPVGARGGTGISGSHGISVSVWGASPKPFMGAEGRACQHPAP